MLGSLKIQPDRSRELSQEAEPKSVCTSSKKYPKPPRFDFLETWQVERNALAAWRIWSLILSGSYVVFTFIMCIERTGNCRRHVSGVSAIVDARRMQWSSYILVLSLLLTSAYTAFLSPSSCE